MMQKESWGRGSSVIFICGLDVCFSFLFQMEPWWRWDSPPTSIKDLSVWRVNIGLLQSCHSPWLARSGDIMDLKPRRISPSPWMTVWLQISHSCLDAFLQMQSGDSNSYPTWPGRMKPSPDHRKRHSSLSRLYSHLPACDVSRPLGWCRMHIHHFADEGSC